MYSDVCGPMLTLFMGGVAYFVTFIDYFSQKVWVYPLRRKYQVLSIFQCFVTLVETQLARKSSVYILIIVGNMFPRLCRIFFITKVLRGS